MESAWLSDREKTAVLWAPHGTKNTARFCDDIFETVSQSFNVSENVKLTMVSAYFNMNNRFIDSLRVPIEHEDEVNKIKGSVSLDLGRVRQYLQTILDN
jgi:alkylhydroperoxidase family enzyme